MKSVRTKLIITAVFFLVMGTGVLSGVSYLKTKEMLTANLEQSITAIAQSSGRETGMWLDARKAEIAVMASTPLVLSGRQIDIMTYLNEEIKRNKSYEMFLISDKTGKAYTSTGSSPDISDRDYFKEALSTGKPVVSAPVVSRASNKLVVVVAVPILKNGSVSGLFGATVLVDELSQKVTSVKVGKTGYAYMTQGNGMFIAHPNKDLVMKYNPLTDGGAHPKLVDAAKRMASGETGVTRYIFDDMDKYMSYAPVPGTKWSLAVTAPVAELCEQLASLPFLYASITIVTAAVIAVILALILGGMLGDLRRVAKEASRIAQGDLTGSQIAAKSQDEIGLLAEAFNKMLENLKDITGQLQEKSKSVAASATELMASAENVSAGAEETAGTISQVASSVEQVTGNARRISASSERAAEYAKEGAEGIKRIIAQMESIQRSTAASAGVINGLNQSAGKITQIVEIITQIAEQTNLLALNAAIEAARAGEQGRGFAVVAEEVRSLSEQSAGAAKEIHSLITTIQKESQRAVQSMDEGSSQVNAGSRVITEVGGTLENIISAVQGLAGEIQSIAVSIGQISSAVENVAAAAQQQTATMEEVSSTTSHLSAMADELEGLSRRFKL